MYIIFPVELHRDIIVVGFNVEVTGKPIFRPVEPVRIWCRTAKMNKRNEINKN